MNTRSYIASCKEDYKANVMFTVFPFPSGRNQMIFHGKHKKKNYSPVYVSRGVFGRGSGRKEILELMTAN